MLRLVHIFAALWLWAAGGGLPAGATDPGVVVTVERKGEAFLLEASVEVAVPPATAWGVLTDFDHMTSILNNLTASRARQQDGNTWIVHQEGVARFGPLSQSFVSEREIRLEPMRRILARSLSGTAKRMESETTLASREQGVHIHYRAEVEMESLLVRVFGGTFIRHEIEEQFLLLAQEMARRHAGRPAAGTPGLPSAG